MFGLTMEDFVPQVDEIISVGEFYERSTGAQIVFTHPGRAPETWTPAPLPSRAAPAEYAGSPTDDSVFFRMPPASSRATLIPSPRDEEER
jgi:hypothetical protein